MNKIEQEVWDLLFKQVYTTSKMGLVTFVMSKEYEKMKRAFNYWKKKKLDQTQTQEVLGK